MEPKDTFRIYCLGSDLDAEIVVQEEQSHLEPGYDYDGNRYGGGPDIKVIDQERITTPDTEKRENAKKELQQIYDSSDWYSVKFAAGRYLFPYNDMKEKLVIWVQQLGMEIIMPDSEKRLHTIKDAGELLALSQNLFWDFPIVRSFIQQEYNGNDDAMIRKEAGKYLGYSSLRIWAHECPVAQR